MKKATLAGVAALAAMGSVVASAAKVSARATKKVAQKVAAVATGDDAAITWPRNHRHVNPHYRERKGGLLYFWMKRRNGSSFVSAQDVGRWMPHNGAREMARRVRQMERANGTA